MTATAKAAGPKDAASAIWQRAGLDRAALDALTIAGSDPVLPSVYRLGTAATTAIGLAGLAAAEIRASAGFGRQNVSVDMTDAAIEFHGERHLRLNHAPPPSIWDALAGLYACREGGWIRVHTNFPNHKRALLAVSDSGAERQQVEAAFSRWDALEAAEAIIAAGGVAVPYRSPEEWRRHPQGAAVAAGQVIALQRIDEAPPKPVPAGDRPLSGLKVLDLTRVIAGPVATRTLAAHGADVLRITGPDLPQMKVAMIDTGRGKRSTQLDLKSAVGRKQLLALVREADVLVDGFRPGALGALGLDPASLAAASPGLIVADLSAYGPNGPWTGRRGFDSIVQTICGINHREAKARGSERPVALPVQALDHATGHLLAFLIQAGVLRRAVEGGSWLVRASLAGTAHWLESLGIKADFKDAVRPSDDRVRQLLEETETSFGPLAAVRHTAMLDKTPAFYARPSPAEDQDEPGWVS